MRTILFVYGTRPEAVKLAPVVTATRERGGLEAVVAVTGQHRVMLDQVNEMFGIVPDHDLDLAAPRQTLTHITTRALEGVGAILEQRRPDMVVVQGDTTTAFASALAATYARVPVAHVEAGLRTADRWSPFPEEINRRMVGGLATIHLAPTTAAAGNLRAEGVDPATVLVTGNTVVDALLATARRRVPFRDPRLAELGDRRTVLVTAHRRESWGAPMAACARAVARVACSHPEVAFVLPAHLNPAVREVLLPPLAGLPNVIVTDPLPYGEFVRLMGDSHLVLTDSGGVQEEAPILRTPVLVMRASTERVEALAAGTVRLVGTDEAVIVREVERLLADPGAHAAMATGANPYGDGTAGRRCADAIARWFASTPGARARVRGPRHRHGAGVHERRVVGATYDPEMSDIAVVTGANSGIGRAIAIHLAGQGMTVHGTVRSVDKAAKLQAMAADAGVDVRLVELDVGDDASVAAGFARILDETGGVVDVLVNNAGIGGNAVAEECPPQLYLDVMNVNLCGAVRCLQQVLPGMRERRRGSIVNITSIAGRVAALAQSPYVASKWAFEGLSEGLAQELAPFGIRVVIVEPGVTKSAIFAKNIDAPNQSGAYEAHYRRMFAFYAAGMARATDPLEVARVIHHAVTTDEPQLRYAVSWGGAELVGGRAAMSDAAWVALGAHQDDDAYYREFEAGFGLDVRPAAPPVS